MQIDVEKILDFHVRRTNAHVNCMNYFAGLVGYHFPEHDNDKFVGSMKNAYAFIVWAKYHPEFVVPDTYRELFRMMHDEHHKMQPHHLEHYDSVTDIDDITLVEMICDWHSANFEQRFVTFEDRRDFDVRMYFDSVLGDNARYNWTRRQLDLIYQIIDFLEMYANHNEIMKIWRPLMDA